MHPMLNIAIRAARAAGDSIVRQMDRVHDIPVEIKSRNDFVTEVDKTAESIIIGTIHASYPQHAILAEETGAAGDNEYRWIIDPLDGTTNFLHGFPQFAVSIALQHKGILDQAVVYDPLRQELFTASRGQGAHLNNRRIRVSSQISLEGALLGTGFPFKDNYLLEVLRYLINHNQETIQRFQLLNRKALKIRCKTLLICLRKELLNQYKKLSALLSCC